MDNKKPKIKVAIKHKEGGESVGIFAAWERPDGKLSATLDKRIKQAAFQMEDGSVHRITRDRDGKPSHWINVYDSADGAPTRSAPRSHNFGATDRDDLPF